MDISWERSQRVWRSR